MFRAFVVWVLPIHRQVRSGGMDDLLKADNWGKVEINDIGHRTSEANEANRPDLCIEEALGLCRNASEGP